MGKREGEGESGVRGQIKATEGRGSAGKRNGWGKCRLRGEMKAREGREGDDEQSRRGREKMEIQKGESPGI